MNDDNIYARLAALEAARAADPRFDRRITKTQLAQRRGTSTRTVDRDVKRGALPPPIVEHHRCYWWLSEIQKHEKRQAANRRRRHITESTVTT